MRPENVVHECLECGRCITKIERHHQVFIVPIVNAECSLVYIFVVHLNLMVPRTKIQSNEEGRPKKFIQGVLDCGYWESILNSDSIKS